MNDWLNFTGKLVLITGGGSPLQGYSLRRAQPWFRQMSRRRWFRRLQKNSLPTGTVSPAA